MLRKAYWKHEMCACLRYLENYISPIGTVQAKKSFLKIVQAVRGKFHVSKTSEESSKWSNILLSKPQDVQHRLESKAPLKSSPRVLKASRRTRHVRHVSFTRVLSGSWMVLATSRLHNSERTMILNHTLYILYSIHLYTCFWCAHCSSCYMCLLSYPVFSVSFFHSAEREDVQSFLFETLLGDPPNLI